MYNKFGWLKLVPILSILFGVALVSGHQDSFGFSIVSLSLILALCFTAYPLSRLIFKNTPEALIFAFPIGFVIHSLFLTFVGDAFGISALPVLIYIAASLVIFLLVQLKGKAIEEPSTWNTFDYVLFYCWLLATLAFIALPYAHVGLETREGFAYRAYFNADFFRNLGVAGSLVASGVPPENPYFAGEILRYHWFFQILPSFWQTLFPDFRADLNMAQFSVVAALMFSASLFVVVRRFTTSRAARVLALPLLILGASYDGILAILHLRGKGYTLMTFRDLNVDGLSRWLWKTPQVDTLLRTMLYGPQHLIALTVLLILLAGWSFDMKRSARWLLVALLFLSVAFSTFIAGLAIAIFGVILAWHALRADRRFVPELVGYVLMGAAFLAVFLKFQMFAADSGQISFGINREILGTLPWYYFLEWGAPAVLGLAGFFWNSGRIPARLLLSGALASLGVILFARLDLTDKSVFSIKFGYLVHLCLFLLSIGFWDRLLQSGRIKWVLVPTLMVILVLPASITTIMDLYNAQDVTNEKFTTYIGTDFDYILKWFRRNLPPEAVIQSDIIHDSGYVDQYVTEIPPLAARRVYLSDPILSQLFQIPAEHVKDRAVLICRLFRSDSPKMIHHLASKASIDFLFVESKTESLAFTRLLEPYFSLAVEQGDMAVFRVNSSKYDVSEEDMKEPGQGVLYREKGDDVVHARFGQNFYPPEPHGLCEKASWMSNDGMIILSIDKEIKGEFSFEVLAITENRTLVAYVNETEVLRSSLGTQPAVVKIPVELKQGKNRVRLVCVEGPEPASRFGARNDQRMLSLKILRLAFRPA
jgi:hypothetical protein